MRDNLDYLERDEFTDEDGMSRNLRSMIRCPECGRAVRPDEIECPECGAIVDYTMDEAEMEDDSIYTVDEDVMGMDTSDADEEPEGVYKEENILSEQDEYVIDKLDTLRKNLEKVHKHHKHSARTSGGWDGSVQAMFTKWVDSNKHTMARLYYLLQVRNYRLRIGACRDIIEESDRFEDSFLRSCLATLKIKGTEQDHFIMWFHCRAW